MEYQVSFEGKYEVLKSRICCEIRSYTAALVHSKDVQKAIIKLCVDKHLVKRLILKEVDFADIYLTTSITLIQ